MALHVHKAVLVYAEEQEAREMLKLGLSSGRQCLGCRARWFCGPQANQVSGPAPRQRRPILDAADRILQVSEVCARDGG